MIMPTKTNICSV